MNKKQPKVLRKRSRSYFSSIKVDAFSDDEKELLNDLCKLDMEDNEISTCIYPSGEIEYRLNKRITRELLKIDNTKN